MKKSVIRVLAVALVFMLAFGTGCSLADSGEWTCPDCGKTGNTDNFCSHCGAKRPESGWTCPDCGKTGNTDQFCTYCGAKKPSQNKQKVDQQLEQIPGETDRVKICLKSVEASKYIKNSKNPDKWLPEHVDDGDESTCWQVSAKKGLKGVVWLCLNVDPEQTVEEIWFKNGMWAYSDAGTNQYYINARAKKIRIEFLYSGEKKFRDSVTQTLKDEVFTDWQRFSLGTHKHVTSVRIWIDSMYKGNDPQYANDVCISEVMLVKYAPAASAKPAPAPKAATVYESSPSISGAKLNQKIATREGPGTQYPETHTYFAGDWDKQTVKVLKKAWNKKNGVWWVQLEFTYQGVKRRLWTGVKRVEVDLNKVKEEKKKGLVHVDATKAYAGPGAKYYKLGNVVYDEDEVEWYSKENGYVEIDYYDVNREVQRRVWVPESAVSNWH